MNPFSEKQSKAYSFKVLERESDRSEGQVQD